MEPEIQTARTVREARRQALLARAIVEQHTGPMKKIVALTKENPVAALCVAFGTGVLAALLLPRD